MTISVNDDSGVAASSSALPLASFAAGAGTATFKPMGVISASTTLAQTGANTTETVLWTYTVPANTLDVNGRALRIQAAGSFASNGNTKTVMLYVGANSVNVNASTAAPNGTAWRVVLTYIRSGAATEKWMGESSVGVVLQNTIHATTLTDDTTGTIVVKITGTNGTATAGDIRFSAGMIEYLP